MTRNRLFVLGVSLAALAPAASANELAISHSALERVLWATLMTENGRLYLEGAPGDDCRYAFVQEPRVRAADGRLVVSLLFSGRAGVSLRGKCVGPGDTFTIDVSGVPAYVQDQIVLDDLEIRSPDSAYFRGVRPLVEAGLRQRLRYPLRAEVERALALASAAAPVRIALRALGVSAISVDADGLRLRFEPVFGVE